MTRKKKKRILNPVRLKSSMEMITLALTSMQGTEKTTFAKQMKAAFGVDYDQALYMMQYDVWRAVMRGLPESASKTLDFLEFLKQCIDYITERRDSYPDTILADPDLCNTVRNAEIMTASDLDHDKL